MFGRKKSTIRDLDLGENVGFAYLWFGLLNWWAMISPRGKLTYLTSQRAFHGQYRWKHPAPPAAWDLWWAGHSPPAPWSLLQHNISFIHIPASINMNKMQELNISCDHCITAEPIKLLGVIWQNDLGWLSHFKSLSPKNQQGRHYD